MTSRSTTSSITSKPRQKIFWLILAVLALVRLGLMAVIPVFEPSEARYAAISANMARSGDYVVPRFTHDLVYQSFDGKPPLVFQAGGLFCEAFGVCEFAVRLFPFLSAVLLLAILYGVVRRKVDADAGCLAVAICASCTAFYAAAGISMTDMTLSCCVTGAVLLYSVFLETNGWASAVGVMALLGAGMIVKGPVALVLFGLPALVDALVHRRWKGIFNIKWLVTAPVFFLIAVPWFVLVERVNPGSVWYFFYNENFLRFISHDYGDKYGAGREAFRGVSVLWALVVTLPWALYPLVRTCVGPRPFWKGIDFKAFPLLALLSIVGFWCLTSRVLLYYLFPVVPLFAYVLVLFADRDRLWRLLPFGSAISLVVLSVGLTGGALFSDKMAGVRTPFVPWQNHYAYEFYHGRLPEAQLEAYRAEREAFSKRLKEGVK